MATQRPKVSTRPAPSSLVMLEAPMWRYAHRALTLSLDGQQVTTMCGITSRIGNRPLGEYCKACEAIMERSA